MPLPAPWRCRSPILWRCLPRDLVLLSPYEFCAVIFGASSPPQHRSRLRPNASEKGEPRVSHIASILLAGLAVLILASGDAFAGATPVPEPGTLALLAAGFGVFAAVKYFARR